MNYAKFARHDEPHHVARIAYKLENQFELTVFLIAGAPVPVGHVTLLAFDGRGR